MARPSPLTFATFVAVPENRSAWAAVQDVLASVGVERARSGYNPLYIHGQAGTGKTHLVSAFAEEAIRRSAGISVNTLAAGGWEVLDRLADDENADEADQVLHDFRSTDVLIVEDLHFLKPRHVSALTLVFDDLLRRQVQMIFTARVGPRMLELPTRLTSRLATGLVVGLEPLSAASRKAVLLDRAQRRQLAVNPQVLDWLAERLNGGRQLEGALCRLEQITQKSHNPLDVDVVAAHFPEHDAICRPTVEGIARRVGSLFQVDLRLLRSEHRGRNVVLPRQVGMYLARQLTGLSLEQIGAYFGGRDHTTVLHACKKVEERLERDTVLSGTVRQLYLDLT
jgi:chromosomal replication initiator protein